MNQPDVLSKIQAVRQDLATTLLERETAIEAALLALLTGEHLLLLGPPGTAKSLLVCSICQRIEHARFYELMTTRFTTPEEVVGPLSLTALERDEYRRITRGTLVEAHIAFLDEIFKANSAILNSLLGIINERVYHEGGQARPVPLLSLFGASNETPEDGGLGALYDRFLLRVITPGLAEDESVRRLFDLQLAPPSAMITLDDLRAAQEQVRQVALTAEAMEAILSVKHGLDEEGISVSDRRWKSCGQLVRAKAWLECESHTSSDHCDVLVHALWDSPSQVRAVERVVSRISNPLARESVELEDAARDLHDQRPAPDHPQLTQALEPLLRQLSDIHTRLEQRIAAVPEKRAFRAKQALGKVETYHGALSQLALKSLSKLHMAPGAA